MWSPDRPYGPASCTRNMSIAVTRPSRRNPILIRPCIPGRARPMKCSSWREIRIITGLPALPRQQRRNRHLDRAERLAAEAAAAVLGDQDQILGRDADQPRRRAVRAGGALGGGVQIALAVLPVRHGAARLERLVRHGLVEHRLVEYEVRLRESGLDVAHLPLVGGGAARRELTPLGGGPVGALPLDGRHVRPGHRVAVEAGVRSSRAQAVERVEHERQRLEVEPDELDGIRGRRLVDRGHGQNRLAFVPRLVGERRLVGRVHRRQVRGGQDRRDPGQGLGGARVDASDPAVRHRAHEQLREQHALRPGSPLAYFARPVTFATRSAVEYGLPINL